MSRYQLVLSLFILLWLVCFGALWSLSLPTTASAANKPGLEQPAEADKTDPPLPMDRSRVPYLSQLHLHGSLSEGTASMAHHTSEAELAGYDVLWWTDHMERQFGYSYKHYLGFENSLERTTGYLTSKFLIQQDVPGFLDCTFGSNNPYAGSYHATCRAEAQVGWDWTEARFSYASSFSWERKSLMAEPEVQLQVRPTHLSGDACFHIRVTLSSRSDGFSNPGIPNIIEYVPSGVALPEPAANVERVVFPYHSWGHWNYVCLDLAGDARQLFWEEDDMSLVELDLVFAARDGGAIEVDLDSFRIQLNSNTDLALFQEQETLLADLHSNVLTHHVGMEVAGPYEHEILEYSTRDHLVALYPDGIPELIDYERDPSTEPDRYPRSGVETIQDQGGIAIIAHPYSSLKTPMSYENAEYLATRMVNNSAWNADGLEVGYLDRGRLLEDFVRLWDELSIRSVFITGVAAMDHHCVKPWDQFEWRWGTWLRSQSDSAPDLMESIRAGEVFFGDPFIFDPDGDVVFAAADDSFSMGDVVPTQSERKRFKIIVDGARENDHMVVYHNAQEVYRKRFKSSSMNNTFNVTVSPGDFMRIELLDPNDDPYLFTNPIYFVSTGTQPPPDRVPGS